MQNGHDRRAEGDREVSLQLPSLFYGDTDPKGISKDARTSCVGAQRFLDEMESKRTTFADDAACIAQIGKMCKGEAAHWFTDTLANEAPSREAYLALMQDWDRFKAAFRVHFRLSTKNNKADWKDALTMRPGELPQIFSARAAKAASQYILSSHAKESIVKHFTPFKEATFKQFRTELDRDHGVEPWTAEQLRERDEALDGERKRLAAQYVDEGLQQDFRYAFMSLWLRQIIPDLVTVPAIRTWLRDNADKTEWADVGELWARASKMALANKPTTRVYEADAEDPDDEEEVEALARPQRKKFGAKKKQQKKKTSAMASQAKTTGKCSFCAKPGHDKEQCYMLRGIRERRGKPAASEARSGQAESVETWQESLN